MSKAIYSLKIYLFRNQLILTDCGKNGIRDICIFIIKIYLKIWVQALVAARAHNEDLSLLKQLYAYNSFDENMSKELISKFSNHLWYLSPECVALAFFDVIIFLVSSLIIAFFFF